MTQFRTPAQPARLCLRMACDVSAVSGIAQQVRVFLKQTGCAEKDVNDCELALVEACNNAVLYAAPDPARCEVGIEAVSGPEQIEVRVTDHTPGLSWPERATLPEATSERGRGLFIIKAVMDSTHYHKAPEGNTLVLQKRRSHQ
ncbi:MAG TPA: anti-sigma regulatory factor [Candidatus Limnocylindrales bacterium]|jgi:serine/threonine-protein kinase RsbW|nr:anti-sigma regulatory factor [Candidatus Limnocylindrales bacterium]